MTRSVAGNNTVVLDLTNISPDICTRIVRRNTMFVIERWQNRNGSSIDRFLISGENVARLMRADQDAAWKAIERYVGMVNFLE